MGVSSLEFLRSMPQRGGIAKPCGRWHKAGRDTGEGTMDHQALARELLRQHEAGEQARPFSGVLGKTDLGNAYRVQRAFVTLLRAKSGAAVAGYKVALTSKRMQEMCGIDHPAGGVILANRVHRSGVVLKAADFGRIGLEFEIAVRLGRDLPASAGPFTAENVAGAVDAVAPAFEIVDDRRADYKLLEIASLVADNAWNGGIVLGAWRTSWPDLAAVRGVVSLNGVEVDAGHGRDVLGHPFGPLAWMAGQLAEEGAGLKAGDIVMTGSLVTTRFPAAGDRYGFVLEGIGDVTVAVEG
jgi:2-keto-4-pentenoate hydratase